MNSSLFSRILSDNDGDASLLDAWLAERDSDLALRPADDEPLPFTVDAARLAQAASLYDAEVRPGQIRLLSPKFVADNDAFPYIAVLDRWMEDIWLVAPFSPYSYPATDAEMATGDKLLGRRVLQCWNARTAHEAIVAQSYVAGTLDEPVRSDALALFRHAMSGKALPADFSALVGSPVLSKADPRCEYLVESAARYAPLTAAVREMEASLARKEQFSVFAHIPRFATQDFALAAGNRPIQTIEAFRVPSRNVEFDVKYSPSEGKVRLVVYKDGERDASALEGVAVVGESPTPVGEIQNGVFIADASALERGFYLRDPESLTPILFEPVNDRSDGQYQ